MEQIEGKNYLTILEVMERLNVCRQTVLRYRLSKKLDFIRLRGKVYITEASYNIVCLYLSLRRIKPLLLKTLAFSSHNIYNTLYS